MTPREVALVDQARATIKDALAHPCDCGECPTDDQFRAMLALDDEVLLAYLRKVGEDGWH